MQFQQLLVYNDVQIGSIYDQQLGKMIKGILVVSKINGNRLFLPAPGMKDESNVVVWPEGSYFYWERDLKTGSNANPSQANSCHIFDSKKYDFSELIQRYRLHGIRPVRKQ